MAVRPYYQQVDIKNTVKLRELISELPPFVKDFFNGIEPTTSSRTRIAYAYDLRVFFNYLVESNPEIARIGKEHLTVSILDQIKAQDIVEYMQYLRYYDKDDTDHVNGERGIMRKTAAVKTMYNYFFKHEIIEQNPAALVALPKIHEKEIIRMDIDEVAILLDSVDSGENLTKRELAYHQATKVRDLALLTLLLGTGLRVSEAVGLDITDVDFKNNGLKVHRKGGKEVVVYFGDEVREALLDYLDERRNIQTVAGHEGALFLSLQKKRINVRSVEKLVKKYTAPVTGLKKITPHKLRSTYGTSLYRETGDIYLVADVLGHSDVNTTRKHYAAMADDQRRRARNAVKLREKPVPSTVQVDTVKAPAGQSEGSEDV